MRSPVTVTTGSVVGDEDHWFKGQMRPLVGVGPVVPGLTTCDHGPNHVYMKTPDAETSSQPVLLVSVATLLILERGDIRSLHCQSIYRTLCRQKDIGYFGWAFLHDPGPKHSTCKPFLVSATSTWHYSLLLI